MIWLMFCMGLFFMSAYIGYYSGVNEWSLRRTIVISALSGFVWTVTFKDLVLSAT